MLHLSVLAEAEDQHFFELAATIIPIILFGSVLAHAFRPPGTDAALKPWHGPAAILLAIYITSMATAEMLAIAAAVGGGGDETLRLIVAVALVVEVFGFGLTILVPWAIRFRQERQTHWALGILLGIVLLLTFAYSSVYFMKFALMGSEGNGLERQSLEAAETADRTLLAWYRAVIAAHADHRLSGLEKHELALLWRRKVEARKQNLDLMQGSPP